MAMAGLQASGVVKNLTTQLARSVTVGVVFFDAAGHVLGAAFTNLVANVEPGAKKGFETVIGTPPINKSAVKAIKAFGSIQDF